MHPGPELTLLMAVMLYRELFDSSPAATQIVVRAPIYQVSADLASRRRASAARVTAPSLDPLWPLAISPAAVRERDRQNSKERLFCEEGAESAPKESPFDSTRETNGLTAGK
jgi:hypothetical protein